MLFSQLAIEVGSWSCRNFGDQKGAGAFAPFLGMIEETGEINRAWSLVLSEPGNQESKHSADIIDGHVDRMNYFADFCYHTGICILLGERDFSPPTKKGVSGELLLSKLERRLSNVVYRLGFGSSQAQGRQLVRHGHVKVNDHKIDIPSYQVKAGDVITLASRATQNTFVTASVEAVNRRGVPRWLELDAANLSGKVLALPARDDVSFPIQEQLIVELYSK